MEKAGVTKEMELYAVTERLRDWKNFKEIWTLDVITKTHVNRRIADLEQKKKDLEGDSNKQQDVSK